MRDTKGKLILFVCFFESLWVTTKKRVCLDKNKDGSTENTEGKVRFTACIKK